MTWLVVMPGEPQGKGRPRFGKGRVYTPARTVSYETALAWEGKRIFGGSPLIGPLHVKVQAYFYIPGSWPRMKREAAAAGKIPHETKPDCDNVLKMLDALNGVAWVDDCQIVKVEIAKHYSLSPSLNILIDTIPPSLSLHREQEGPK